MHKLLAILTLSVIATPLCAQSISYSPEQRQFWSFQPVHAAAPPSVRDKTWPQSDLDRFILARLETQALGHAPAADKRTLIRRATFDLTGLPPKPADIKAFLDDKSPQAFEHLVDRLLASPEFGERWGRHWLDLVRYTDSFDSRGIGGEMDCADAWRYRDWVVNALNSDMPYDRFVRMQIAGDLIPDAKRDGIIATGMLAIGNWGGGDADKEKLLTDNADDQLDVVCKTFMALTVSCARCHDHKFDPISQRDYYALAGIFFSTHILPNVGPKTNGPPMLRIPIDTPADRAERNEQIALTRELFKELNHETTTRYRGFAMRMQARTADYLMATWDFAHQPADNFKPLEQFAKERKLVPLLLSHWLDALAGGDDKLLTTPIKDLGGNAGVVGWRGDMDTPWMLLNTTDQEVAMSTYRLPPKSISVHPGPQSGVVLAWKSPIAGTVEISGSVNDADPTCGDGVAWAIDLRTPGARREIAKGDIPNGGRQEFGKQPISTAVRVGDVLEFVILPKASHACDSTTLNLTIANAHGNEVWKPVDDWMSDLLAGNPHPDRFGHAGVWSVADMGARRRGKPLANTAVMLWSSTPENSSEAERRRLAEEIQNQTHMDDTSPFWPHTPADEAVLDKDSQTRIAGLRARFEKAKELGSKRPPFANGAQDGGVPDSPQAGVHDVHLHMRGRYDKLGEIVPRGFPEILAGNKQGVIGKGSGRLQLAQWLTRPSHPLTARVMANRVWQHLLGEGIVRTPSNFGKLGERPTHPELLDWLADKFVKEHWSIKGLIRTVMLSATYQQSSVPLADSLKSDPDNRLFGRMNRRRLEAEALRDALLAVSGWLDATRGGPAEREFETPRRSIYLVTIRSDRSGFGPLFDAADPTTCIEKRTVSTVAPQALFMLNHPFVIENARHLAKRTQGEANEQRIKTLYEIVYGRSPTNDEIKIGTEFVSRLGSDSGWASYCQLLLCANEFTYVD